MKVRNSISKQFGSQNEQDMTSSFFFKQRKRLVKREHLETEEKNIIDEKNDKEFGKEMKDMNESIRNRTKMKELIKKNKIKILTKNIQNKLKRNNTESAPVSLLEFDQGGQKISIYSCQGLNLSRRVCILFSFVYVIQFLVTFLFYGMGAVFHKQIQYSEEFLIFQFLSLVILIVQIAQGVFCQKIVRDRKLVHISEILRHYARDTFAIDSVCLLVLLIDLSGSWPVMRLLRLCFFLKAPEFLRKMAELEIFFVTNFEREQYWGVIKVFLINFLMAHLIGVLLLSIAEGPNNWMHSLGISEKPWNEKYAYAYFWAMSTMLGFGNAVPSNHREAILISIIECFSCIMLAYIINHVGTLLTNIAKKNEDKEKNLQTSRRLAEENNISDELRSKITNHIKLNDYIESKFNFNSDKAFLNCLPNELRCDFLRESNKKTFEITPFFRNFSTKTLTNLAEKLELKIACPEQIIFVQNGMPFKFMILKSGEIGYFYRRQRQEKSKLINKVIIEGRKNPFLVNLSYLFDSDSVNSCEIKSMNFSTLYELEFETFKQVLKSKQSDYERFCLIRDKSKHQIDEFEVLECKFCGKKHSLLLCPKLHFTPLKKIVVFKFLDKNKHQKNMRSRIIKRVVKGQQMKPFWKYLKEFRQISHKFFSSQRISLQYCAEIEVSEIEDCKKSEVDFLMKTLKSLKKNSEIVQQQSLKKSISDMKIMIEEFILFSNQNNKSFWTLEADSLMNYKEYFPRQNPDKLNNLSLNRRASKFQLQIQTTRKQKPFGMGQ